MQDRPQHRNGPVVVLFSGGSDSTLVASMLAETHSVVHLVTYRHRIMRHEEKCLNSLESLRKAHGTDRFRHEFLDLNPLLNELYFRSLAGDLRRWGTYALPMCCGACKLAMHARTILYAREHGISEVADGSNVEMSELFPEQMPKVLALYAELYRRFNLRHSTPVYDVRRSDHCLFDRGVTRKKDYKSQVFTYTNQHSCFAGTLLHSYALGISIPLFGWSADEEKAEAYVRAKMEEVCIPLLEQRGS